MIAGWRGLFGNRGVFVKSKQERLIILLAVTDDYKKTVNFYRSLSVPLSESGATISVVSHISKHFQR